MPHLEIVFSISSCCSFENFDSLVMKVTRCSGRGAPVHADACRLLQVLHVEAVLSIRQEESMLRLQHVSWAGRNVT